MVQVGEGEGVIDSEESELIHNVIKFGETTAAEVMTPKIDMFTLSIDDKLEDISTPYHRKFLCARSRFR